MFAKAASSTPAVPSRNALRALRQLALAGTTVGSLCAVATITYDVHRRVHVAEQIIENKRTLRTSAPNYDATSSAKRLAAMMEAAEAGEFMGLDSLKKRPSPQVGDEAEGGGEEDNIRHGSRPGPRLRRRNSPFALNPVRPAPSDIPGAEAMSQERIEIALTREAREAEEARAAGKLPLEEEIRELLSRGRDIEATNYFLKTVWVPKGHFISWERRELMRQLFAANCMRGNIFIARSLFERMDKVTVMDSEVWAMMMHALAKDGHLESVGVIFEKYRNRLIVPSHLLEVVLRCLLESRRLNLAKWLFYARIKHDEEGALCGAYLDGLWRKTRKSDLVMSEFRTILTSLASLGRKPTEKVFNPLVKAFIEAGKHEDAEALVKDMPGKWDVQPGCRTLGLLVYGRALLCDWDAVMIGLRDMHARGLTREKRNFAIAFDRIFLEYYPAHSGRQIFDFLLSCIEQFSIVPDKTLHRHILEALVERGDSHMIQKITSLAEERGWKTGIDQDSFVKILHARRVSMQDTPVGFWKMLQAAKQQYGIVASTRRLLGSSAENYTSDKLVLSPIHTVANESYSTSMDSLISKKSIDHYMPVHKRMEHYMHGGNFVQALETFQTANNSGFQMKPFHIQLAVIATILEHGLTGLEDAKKIIKTEWPYWNKLPTIRYTPRFPRFVPIFFQQIMQLESRDVHDTTLYKLALFEFYKICANTRNLHVKHHVSAVLSRRMIKSRRPRQAISLLRAIYLSIWRKTHGFDQVQFKMLLRAYATAGNARGVWWCICAILTGGRSISGSFVAEVRSVMPRLEVMFKSPYPDSPASHNLRVLRRLAKAVEQAHEKDYYWYQFAADRERKRKMRTKVISRIPGQQAYLPSKSVESMLASFDEEVEFDLLEPRRNLTTDELVWWWDEKTVPFEHRLLPEHPDYPEPAVLRVEPEPVDEEPFV